jgi:type I restriction enzyme S subunit
MFPKGTLLIALYGATIGKLGFLGIDACTNQAVCAIFENDKVILKYLYYYLLLHRADLIEQGVGGAQPNISQTILKKLVVSYPEDKAEQEAIVSKIEEQSSMCDNLKATLLSMQDQLEVFKLSLLKKSLGGDLDE